MKRLALLLSIFLTLSAHAYEERGPSLQSIFLSLDPTSVSQHFAFYELYPDTPIGKKALRHAWDLLQGGKSKEKVLPSIRIQPLIAFVNRLPSSREAPLLDEEQLQTIEKLARHLKNRKLKGFGLWDPKQLNKLNTEEIDLARGLFLAEMEEDTPDARSKIRSYEANMDLMALQILARLPDNATPQEKIRVINDYVFTEMRFRFPPHSLYAKDIDVYTLLPSVLDSRRGVCLGVSILYLCLAQRLELSLEAITPPGHIFVRHVDPETEEIINIETTARGIDVPSEAYLGIETPSLQTRSIREVIGLAFMNQASVSWHRADTESAISLYKKSLIYLKDDYLIEMFLGFNYLFAGKIKEGKALLKKIQKTRPKHMLSSDSVSEDYLAGKTDAEGIKAVFEEVNENRSSILKKQEHIQTVLSKFPEFRQGILHLAITYLQLGREKEALPILERYIKLRPEDPTGNYYLSAIHFQRVNFAMAWKYLPRAEPILAAHDHRPKALKDLRQALLRACPEPTKSNK
jgi:regulator of sirC expression with transglutaminase-like and TPR domain